MNTATNKPSALALEIAERTLAGLYELSVVESHYEEDAHDDGDALAYAASYVDKVLASRMGPPMASAYDPYTDEEVRHARRWFATVDRLRAENARLRQREAVMREALEGAMRHYDCGPSERHLAPWYVKARAALKEGGAE